MKSKDSLASGTQDIGNDQAHAPVGQAKHTRRQFLKGGVGLAGLALVSTPLVSFLAGCGKQEASSGGAPAVITEKPTLRITGWGGAWGELYEREVLPRFMKEYNCKVEVDTAFPFEPKLLASPKEKPIYDMFHSNAQPVVKMAEAGYLQEGLTAKEIPNLKDAYDYVNSDLIPGISVFVSGVGLGYRTDKIADELSSWKDLWEAKYADSRATYVITNNLGVMLVLMAGEMYGGDYKDVDAGLEAIKSLKPIKLVDFTGTMEKHLTSGEVSLGVVHDSAIWRHPDQPLTWVAPKEGVPALEQVMAVTKGSDKKELAQAFINFMLEPEIQQLMADNLLYGVANKNVRLTAGDGKLFDTPEKVATLRQFDWSWYNTVEQDVVKRYTAIFQG